MRASYWYDGEPRSTDPDCVKIELESTALASDRAVVSTQPQDNFDSRLEYVHVGTFSLQQQQQQQQPSGPQTADLDLSCVSSAEGSESSGLAEEAENCPVSVSHAAVVLICALRSLY